MNAADVIDRYGEMTLAMAQSQMFAAMANVKKKDVAKRLGVTPPYVSSLFKGDTDVTMRQFGRVLAASGFEVRFWLIPIPRVAT